MNSPRLRRRWRKMKKNDAAGAEALLRANERWCLNACGRFLNSRGPLSKDDAVWVLKGEANDVPALIVHSRQSLLPVLRGRMDIPPPDFLRRLFGTVPVHSLQGRKEDALILEAALEKMGLAAAVNTDYDLMCLDRPPSGFQSYGPAGLVIRRPQYADIDALAELQAAYELVEVLPAGAVLNPAVSRLNTERIFREEQILVAVIDGRLAGKINTNASGFTRFQVGGVYVHPDYRGLGIARRMTGEFAAGLICQGRGVTLFVKKANTAARRAYQSVGFELSGDYRISYY